MLLGGTTDVIVQD